MFSTDSTSTLIRALRENAPVGPSTEPHLRAVISESAAHPGRLVRARLVYAAARVHGLETALAEQLACSIEFFHLASLLLDDLPCMDDAQTRRGRPCAHRLHGEASTILASLAFINRAYALANLAFASQPPNVRVAAHTCLDACLGTAGLVGGQALDLRFAEGQGGARAVAIIAVRKTAALFWLSVVFPALLGQPSSAELRELKALCLYWGLAYQAVDDLGDVLASSIDSGKTTGRDRALNRPNLALALGVPAARRRLVRLARQATATIDRLERTHPRWEYLVTFHRTMFIGQVASLVDISAAQAA
ncbi:MAG: polyprenyl synthetase family protein [Opitutaceae bacterium]|nr:polyprenyl synthetase family protein [Opitutaceae bacterium]